jgi:hypothetical protein
MSREVDEKNERDGRIWWGAKGTNSVPALHIAFYNACRPHSSLLDRRTPDEVYFESLPLAAAA